MAFLTKEISREEWGDRLYRQEVKRERDERFLNFIKMMTHNGGDLLKKFVADLSKFVSTLQNLDALVTYANEQVEVFNRH